MTPLGPDSAGVAALVYIAAFGLDQGESLGALLGGGPPTPALAHLASQNLPQARDVVGERRLRKLRRRHVYPSACRDSMTALQLDPSAHAPWTSTMPGLSLI